MDKAPDFGSGDCRFESCHARTFFSSLYFGRHLYPDLFCLERLMSTLQMQKSDTKRLAFICVLVSHFISDILGFLLRDPKVIVDNNYLGIHLPFTKLLNYINGRQL